MTNDYECQPKLHTYISMFKNVLLDSDRFVFCKQTTQKSKQRTGGHPTRVTCFENNLKIGHCQTGSDFPSG